MAPEVLSSTQYDQKADIYSFGMIMFEVICREIPFEEYEPAQVRQMVQCGNRPDPDAVPPDCPQNLVQTFCLKISTKTQFEHEKHLVQALSDVKSAAPLWLR